MFHGFGKSVIAAVIFAVMSPGVPAQTAHHDIASATKARVSDGVPNLSGVWMGTSSTFTFDPNNPRFRKPDETPMTPAATSAFKELRVRNQADHFATDPTLSCEPPGYPRLLLFHFPIEILQLPDRVVMIFEFQHFVREIFTDGRPHPANLEPTYMGNAVGHWEGNTLVVDTIGFNDKTWLDQVGHPHSDALHLTERITRLNAKTLEDDLTVDDPKTFTHPWHGRRVFNLKPGWTIDEYICEDTVNLKRVPDNSTE